MGNKNGKPKEPHADALKERKVTRNQELKKANREVSAAAHSLLSPVCS